MFEHRRQPLLARKRFYVRFARGAGIGLSIILGSLAVGMAGYHWFERMPWLDAFVNVAMILSGMGSVGQLQTNAGKLFAGCYALYSGLALITSVGSSLRRSSIASCINFMLKFRSGNARSPDNPNCL